MDLSLIIQIVSGFMLALIAFLEWSTNKNQYKYNILDRYLRNYDLVSKAISLSIKEGKITDEILQMLWEAHSDAQLILHDDIAILTDRLLEAAKESYFANRKIQASLHAGIKLDPNELKELNENANNSLSELEALNKSLYVPYRKFTRLARF